MRQIKISIQYQCILTQAKSGQIKCNVPFNCTLYHRDLTMLILSQCTNPPAEYNRVNYTPLHNRKFSSNKHLRCDIVHDHQLHIETVFKKKKKMNLVLITALDLRHLSNMTHKLYTHTNSISDRNSFYFQCLCNEQS